MNDALHPLLLLIYQECGWVDKFRKCGDEETFLTRVPCDNVPVPVH